MKRPTTRRARPMTEKTKQLRRIAQLLDEIQDAADGTCIDTGETVEIAVKVMGMEWKITVSQET